MQGRVLDGEDIMRGVYVSGWLKTGATGVIATTMYDSFQTAECILDDLSESTSTSFSARDETEKWLKSKKRIVTFEEWKLVEQEEKRRGALKGKTIEKFSDWKSVLEFLDGIKRNRIE
jgi:adrenodoxin-NADP+ reductase